MKNFFYKAAMACMAMTVTVSLASCGDDDANDNGGNNNNGGNITITDNNNYTTENQTNPSNSNFNDRAYGQAAVNACANVETQLEAANDFILRARSSMTSEQVAFLNNVIANTVDNVIVPTYTTLADNTEKLEQVLNGLSVNTITQQDINNACQYFGEARVWWELSEAFLGGAASDFSVDPTIDSWPLSRSKLHTYFSGNMNPEELDDESILGFHAIEFILFRNGQPRKVEEFKGNDTYNGFEDISGEKELKYAQQVAKLLKERTFQLQVAWEGETSANASRVNVVKAAGLGYVTEKGLSYGNDMKQYGTANSKYANITDVITQLLSHDEGSALAIAHEVGTAKIANPFSNGEISYVESPYSWRSIVDFQDNIRSVRNVWYGNLNGTRDLKGYSFYSFFAALSNGASVNLNTVNAFTDAINKIGEMPAPFVKYCSTIWNKEFSEEEYEGEEE